MATINKGILGGFSGKVGTVVGAKWRGKDVMRSLPTASGKTPTALQLAQRERFSLVIQFLTPIKSIVGKYFGIPQNSKSRLNEAVGYHLKNAITPVGDTYEMDYPEVLISKGDLPGLQSPGLTAGTGTQVALTWEDNSNQGLAQANDSLYVVFYSPATGYFEMFDAAANRDEEGANFTLPGYFGGDDVEGWATFIAADEQLAATSSYLGSITLP